MILKAKEVKTKEFKGVSLNVCACSEKLMITKMNYKKGNIVSPHNHFNEQAGYVISGRIRLKFSGYNEILQAGDSYIIPENIIHSVEVLESGEVIDIFTPPRNDYK